MFTIIYYIDLLVIKVSEGESLFYKNITRKCASKTRSSNIMIQNKILLLNGIFNSNYTNAT